MATLREVTIVSSLSPAPTKFMTSAATFNELKSEFSENNVSYNEDLKAGLRTATGVETLLDASPLPDESFIIMMTPKKVKSGK